MRRALALVVVVGSLTACGGTGSDGDLAERTIRGDWNFNSDFPSAPRLKDSTVPDDGIRCPDRVDARGRIRCQVSPEKDGRRLARVTVVAQFDDSGVLRRWSFA